MIDNIILTIGIHFIAHVFNRINKPLEAFGLSFDPVFRKGEIVKYQAQYCGLRLTIRGDELTIQNSICKAYHGCNHVNLTFSEFLNAKSVLEAKLGLSLDSARIRSFEFGVVLQVVNPSLVYNSFGMYKNRTPELMLSRGSVYGICFQNTTHKLKIYDKTKEAKRNGFNLDYGLLRVEKKVCPIHLNTSPRFKSNSILTFGDLCRRNTFQLLADDLVLSLNKIELNDIGHYTDDLSVKDLRLLGYMQTHPVRKLIKQHHPKSFEIDQKRYKEILADRNQNNRDNFILKVVEVLERVIIS